MTTPKRPVQAALFTQPHRENTTMTAITPTNYTRNQLKGTQAYQLNRWAEDNRDKTAALTHDQMAQVATGALGFTVTPGNIKGAERTLNTRLGVQPVPRMALPADDADRRVIARSVLQLYLALGQEVPRELELLAAQA